MKKGAREEGTIIRGVDGELYFLPDSALKAYRLPPEERKEVSSRLDELFADQPAVSVNDYSRLRAVGPEDTTVSLVDLGALRRG